MFHNSLDINNVTELCLRTLVYFGCGAIRKIEEIAAALEKRGIGKLLIVTGRGAYKKTGAWDQIVPALAAHKIDYVLFDKVTPNPTTTQIDEAVEEARSTRERVPRFFLPTHNIMRLIFTVTSSLRNMRFPLLPSI